jgi:phosphatidylglycerophosphate synthase
MPDVRAESFLAPNQASLPRTMRGVIVDDVRALPATYSRGKRSSSLMSRRPRVSEVISTRNRMLLWFTISRLILVPPIIVTFMLEPIVTTVALGLFMITDLGDGVIARWLGADDFQRRAVDSVVDRVAIDSCLIAATVAGALPFMLLIGFLARDAYCTMICVRMVRKHTVVIKADIFYRALNCSIAVWALAAPLMSAAWTTGLAIGILAAAIAVAVDLKRCVGSIEHGASTPGRVVLSPRSLRRSRIPATSDAGPPQKTRAISSVAA